MNEHIAVGLDGSRESLAAADWAAREALRRRLPLRLVHAWEGLTHQEREAIREDPAQQVPHYWARRILRTAENDLNLRHPHLRITADLVLVHPMAAVARATEAAQLLALGSRGLGGVTGFLVGSVAMSTVAHASKPVALVRAGHRAEDEHLLDGAGKTSAATPYREVVVGLDARRPCEPVLEFAFDSAARRAAELRVVYLWNPPSVYADFPTAATELEVNRTFEARARQAVALALRPWREKYPDQPVVEVLRTGKPARQLLAVAEGAGLLVVGRRIRRTAAGMHIGPVAHAVIHRAKCPVIVVPHE
ncbi:universal stress protein [Streptomyces rimosus]|uniref:universal stress protein n=1 Tax=Streptomyces rimosus TaxID=1927 RepID=UPI0006B26D4C|nr:universal stress protein [Streptomyces rimosus]